MSDTDAQTETKPQVRIFSTPDKYGGAPFLIGRNHASWFLVFARPYGMRMKRADLCLNFVTSDPSTVGATSPDTGRPRFSIGGSMGEEALSILRKLKDSEGRCPITVIRRSPEGRSSSEVIAEVQVDVPETELAYACARCGKWEAGGGERWLRCSECKVRYYCSKECQKNDWKPALHKGECDLLKQGRAFEVECRRGLHDNEWWMSGMLRSMGSESSVDHAARYEDAMDNRDWDYLGYGSRDPLHSASCSSRWRSGPHVLDELYDLSDDDDPSSDGSLADDID